MDFAAACLEINQAHVTLCISTWIDKNGNHFILNFQIIKPTTPIFRTNFSVYILIRLCETLKLRDLEGLVLLTPRKQSLSIDIKLLVAIL